MIRVEGPLTERHGRAFHWLELKPGQHPQTLIPEGSILYDCPNTPEGRKEAERISGGGEVTYIETGYPFKNNGRVITHGKGDATHGFGAGPLPPLKK